MNLIAAVPDEKEMEFVTESETELATPMGSSKMKVKMENLKINEPVEFKWVDVKAKKQEKVN